MKSGMQKGIIVNAQEYSFWKHKMNLGNVGRGLREWISDDYKAIMEILNDADNTIRERALNTSASGTDFGISLKEAVKSCVKALEQKPVLYIDCYYYSLVTSRIIRTSLEMVRANVNSIRKVGLEPLSYSEIEVDDVNAPDGLKTEAQLKWLFKKIMGDPIERAYRKQVEQVKRPIEALKAHTQRYEESILRMFNEMGIARAKGDVLGWISLFDKMDSVTKSFESKIAATYNVVKPLVDVAKSAKKSEEVVSKPVAQSLNIMEQVESTLPEASKEDKKQVQQQSEVKEDSVPEQVEVQYEEPVVTPVGFEDKYKIQQKKQVAIKKDEEAYKLFIGQANMDPNVAETLKNALKAYFANVNAHETTKRVNIEHQGKVIGFTSMNNLYINDVKSLDGNLIPYPIKMINTLADALGVDRSNVEEHQVPAFSKSIEPLEKAKEELPPQKQTVVEKVKVFVEEHGADVAKVVEENGELVVEDENGNEAIFTAQTIAIPSIQVEVPVEPETVLRSKETVETIEQPTETAEELNNDFKAIVSEIQPDTAGEAALQSEVKPEIETKPEEVPTSIEEPVIEDIQEEEGAEEETIPSAQINSEVWKNVEVSNIPQEKLRAFVPRIANELSSKLVTNPSEADFVIVLYPPKKLTFDQIEISEEALKEASGSKVYLVPLGNVERLKGALEDANNIASKVSIVTWEDGDLIPKQEEQLSEEPTLEDDAVSKEMEAEAIQADNERKEFEKAETATSTVDSGKITATLDEDVFDKNITAVEFTADTLVKDGIVSDNKDPANRELIRLIVENITIGADFDNIVMLYNPELLTKEQIPAASTALRAYFEDEDRDLVKVLFAPNDNKKKIKDALISVSKIPFVVLNWSEGKLFNFNGEQAVKKSTPEVKVPIQETQKPAEVKLSKEPIKQEMLNNDLGVSKRRKAHASLQELNEAFYSTLKKEGTSRIKIASMLLDHAELIEELDYKMASELITQAEKLIND